MVTVIYKVVALPPTMFISPYFAPTVLSHQIVGLSLGTKESVEKYEWYCFIVDICR
jgi:hypothetical protein